jgi:hypothetical protein
MRSRDERIEEYYHHGTRELAEWLVDLEDELSRMDAIYRESNSLEEFADRILESLEERNRD